MQIKIKNSTLLKVGAYVIYAGVLFLNLNSALAQQSTEQEAAQNPVLPNVGMSREQMLALIANETVLAPGIGLRNVRLGESLSDVRNRLGAPVEETTEGLINRRLNLVYALDSGTVIVLSGENILDRISVRGNSSALVRTSEGARFGMQSRLILQIYNEPSKVRDSRLEFDQIGATFYFDEDRVIRIDLYPREQ